MYINGIVQGGQINLPYSVAADSNVANNNSWQDICEAVNAPRIDEKDIQNILVKMNEFLQHNKTHAEYSVHDKLKNVVMIKIVDDKTGDVIKEIPPKRILDMVAKMCEEIGVIVDDKA